MDNPMAVSGEKIKALREVRAWSQAHLAEAASLSVRTVQRVEAEGTASAETRLAIAAALGVSVETLNMPDSVHGEPDDSGAGGWLPVLAVSSAGLLFALWLGSGLPPVVASHFGAAGEANGHMTRDQFVALMCIVLGVLPLVMLSGMTRALRRRDRLKIPDADYWLAPSRRPGTERWLRRHFMRMCVGLPIFLAYVFWRVAEANRGAPAQAALAQGPLLAGLAVFLAATVAWIVVLHRHFRR